MADRRYFSPIEPLLTALQLAAAREVDARMLVAGKSDHPILVNVLRSYYEELLRFGVKIYEYEARTQSRQGCADPRGLADVRSADLDVRSMRLNFELNALGRDAAMAGDLARVLRGDFETSKGIVEEEFPQRPQSQCWTESLVRP